MGNGPVDPKIQALLDAGMVLELTKQNLPVLLGLTQEQVNQLAAIAAGLVPQKATLAFTTFPSIQPPFLKQ